jgi:hypothetical protein
MKTTTLILAATVGVAASFPIAAHHNCAAGDACPEDIGDMQGNHEAIFADLTDEMGDPVTGGDPVDIIGNPDAREEGDNASDSNAGNVPAPQSP